MYKTSVIMLPPENDMLVTERPLRKRTDVRGVVKELLEWLLLFELSRVELFGVPAPFGLAVLAACLQNKCHLSWRMVSAVVGGCLLADDMAIGAVYCCAALLTIRIYRKMSRLEHYLFTVPAVLATIMICGGCTLEFIRQADLYEHSVIVLQGLIMLLSTYIFYYAVPIIDEEDWQRLCESEIAVSSFIIIGLALYGVGQVEIAGCSLQHTAAGFGIISMAMLGGSGLAALFGVIVGTILGLNDAMGMNLAAVCALGGIFAGMFCYNGKAGVIAGYFLGTLSVSLLIMPLTRLPESSIEMLVSAAAAVLFSYPEFSDKQKTTGQVRNNEQAHADSIAKLTGMADVFEQMAVVMQEEGRNRAQGTVQEPEGMVRQAVNGICSKCKRRDKCWGNESYQRYHLLLRLLESFIDKNNIDKVQQAWDEKCEKAAVMKYELIRIAARYELEGKCQGQLWEQKQMLGEEMNVISKLLEEIAAACQEFDVNEIKWKKRLSEKISFRNCSVKNIVTGTDNLVQQVTIEKKPCRHSEECSRLVMPAVASIIERPLTMQRKCGDRFLGKKCSLCFRTQKMFKVNVGMAHCAKNGQRICGDKMEWFELEDGNAVVILSDGMGGGGRAASESRRAVRYMKRLLINGFAAELAVKMVNSMLYLQADGTDEKFATVDMAVINQYTGWTSFIKAASAPTYIKRVRELKRVEAQSLPAGIVHTVDITALELQLAQNDYIVLLSDGIDDIKDKRKNSTDKDGWFELLLRRLDNTDEQEIAKLILQEALAVCNDEPADDMSVLVVQLRKENSWENEECSC